MPLRYYQTDAIEAAQIGDEVTWTETHTKKVEHVYPDGTLRLRNHPNEWAVSKHVSEVRPRFATQPKDDDRG